MSIHFVSFLFEEINLSTWKFASPSSSFYSSLSRALNSRQSRSIIYRSLLFQHPFLAFLSRSSLCRLNSRIALSRLTLISSHHPLLLLQSPSSSNPQGLLVPLSTPSNPPLYSSHSTSTSFLLQLHNASLLSFIITITLFSIHK